MLFNKASHFTGILILLISLLNALTVTASTRIHRRHTPHGPPSLQNHKPRPDNLPPTYQTKVPYKSITYYTNWATYARDFHPQNLTTNTLTHIHYAFANISPQNGTLTLSDPYADIEKKFPSDLALVPPPASNPTTNSTEENLYGCLKQLYLLKKSHRHLKTLLSIGGATYTKNFAPALSTSAGRTRFINSSVTLMLDLGFDGLEIDWESPESGAEAESFVSVLCGLRDMMDAVSLERKVGYRFLLAASVHANPPGAFEGVLGRIGGVVDYMNLMAYDYAGSFTNLTGHASNLRPSLSSPVTTPFSTRRAMGTYIRAGVPLHKLTLGMPLYGRSFLSTTGLGKPYSGIGNGSFEPGIWDYKDLPLAGAKEIYDEEVGASYSFGGDTANVTMGGGYGKGNGTMKGTLVSYDNMAAVEAKA
ncbi:MAG: hypothetical protein Q9174_004295, partial [Haloplaca sp. 1 TL-2023]